MGIVKNGPQDRQKCFEAFVADVDGCEFVDLLIDAAEHVRCQSVRVLDDGLC